MRGTADEHMRAEVGFIPDAHATGTVNGAGIDKTDFDEALVVLNIGTIEATGTSNVKVQDSADNSSFADVTGAAFGEKTPSNDNTIVVGRLNLRKLRKFIRTVLVQGTAAGDLGCVVILASAGNLAVSQVASSEFSV